MIGQNFRAYLEGKDAAWIAKAFAPAFDLAADGDGLAIRPSESTWTGESIRSSSSAMKSLDAPCIFLLCIHGEKLLFFCCATMYKNLYSVS